MSSINKPGLAKLNTQSTTLGSASFKSTTANKLASSTRSGQSYGIMAQRSAVGSGAIFNVKRYNSASISAQRHALNDNRAVIRNNNIVAPPTAHNCSGNNSMNKYAAALAITGMLTKTLGSVVSASKSSNAAQTSSVAKNGTAGVINELATAKNSADIQKGLAKVETEMKDYETKIAKAEETISKETKLKSENETKLKDTENQISEQNQNLRSLTSTKDRLEASIDMNETYLEQLERSLTNSTGELAKMGIQNQINELKAKIAQEKKQLEDVTKSKNETETKLKELNNTKGELTNQISTNEKNIQEAEAEKNSASSKKDSLEEAKVKYTKKLSEAQNKESKELSKLHTEIANYAKEFQETTDADKKSKLAQKYAGKAKEYNELVRNSTVSGHTEVGLDLNS